MRSIGYIVIILLSPFLILANFRLLVFNQNFYQKEFAKLGVYDQFPNKDIVDQESKHLIKYLCCNGSLDQNFFTEREILHMSDVKNLIKLVQIQLTLTGTGLLIGILFLIIKKAYRILINSLFWGSIVTIISIIFLALSSFANFDFTFLKFHQFLLTNDLWLLPEDSNLIRLFPQQFFADFANRIAMQTILMSFATLVISLLIKKQYVAKNN